jgi:hypothetical protein
VVQVRILIQVGVITWVAVLLLGGGAAFGEDECWVNDSIVIDVTGTGFHPAEFGVNPAGTDCFDNLLDGLVPPPPPGGVATAIYFQLHPACGVITQVVRDIREDAGCADTRQWELHIEDTGAAIQVDLQWPAAPIDPVPACLDHLWLRQWPTDFDGGAGRWVVDTSGAPLGEVDMLATNTYSYAKGGFFDHSGFTITLECSVPQAPPAAVDDAESTDEDTPVTIDVLLNDTDPNPGDVLVVVGVTDPPNGTATNNGTSVTYTPDPDSCGGDTFAYTVGDGHGNTDTATVTIDVVCQPDSPVAEDDVATVDEDSADNVIPVLVNDHDPDIGDAITLMAATQGAHGTTTVQGNEVLYTPDPDVSGPDAFTYTVEDSTGRADTATVDVTITGLPDPPVAGDDAFTVPMDSGLNVLDVLANDSDPDPGDVLTIQSVGPPSPPGECPTIINAGDHIKYAPCPGFFGETTLTYIVEDATGLTDVATVTIEIPETLPDLFFDDFETPDGWASTGQWFLRDEGFCCPDPMVSETHAWCFGVNGRFFANGVLTSPWIGVVGFADVDVTFWYCFDVSMAFGLRVSLEADVGNGWFEVAGDVLAVEGEWTRFGPATVPIPEGAAEMRLRLNLRSRLGWGCICVDDVRVMPAGVIQNEPPVAVAGDDQTPFVGTTVHLDGSESWDPDRDPLAFNWLFIATPDGVAAPELTGADTATPTFTATVEGVYVVELTVDDGRGGTDSDTVTVDVQPLGDLLFFDDMESGVNGWAAQGGWALVDGPDPGTASGVHAWQYGNGLLSGTGTLTSVSVDVSEQAAVSIQFSQFLHVESYGWFSPAGTRGELQVQFNDGTDWQTVGTWHHDDPNQDVWYATAPVLIDVPAVATLMRVRFLFTSRLARGGWWIDDVRVMAGGDGAARVDPAGTAAMDDIEGFQVFGVRNVPNPVRDVHTTRFEVQGVGVEGIKVQIFDISGALVFDSGWQRNGYEWHLESNEGRILANGVYLYQVMVRGVNGQVVLTETKKLAVVR